MFNHPLDLQTDIQTEVLQAEQRSRPYVRETPLDHSPMLSQMSNAQGFLKLEAHTKEHFMKPLGKRAEGKVFLAFCPFS